MLAVKFDLQKAPPDLNELLTLVKNGTEVVLFEGDIAIARIVPILDLLNPDSQPIIWVADDPDETEPSKPWFGLDSQ